MNNENVEVSSLVIKELIKRPPTFFAVEVTRENYQEVADRFRCHEILVKSWNGVIQAVTFIKIANDESDITVEFHHSPDAKAFRRWYLIQGEDYSMEKISETQLQNYLEIKQEESIIA